MSDRYVIIGGSGFLGQNLAKLLASAGEQNIVLLDMESPPSDEFVFQRCDISKKIDFAFDADDIVIHLAARQYHLQVPKKNVLKFFTDVNVDGTRNVLEQMHSCGASKMIYFSTDMVYGIPHEVPVKTSHPQNPVGEYGLSKKISESICREYREKGFNITIFRPRMITGRGRMGVLVKLFKLVRKNLPVPMIGSGANAYQMISVDDCSSAILCAVKKGFPNKEYNLGSKNPPRVKDLLSNLIKISGSKSFLVPTCGPLVKFTLKCFALIGIRIMYKEQYTIADINYLVSTEETERDLEWTPRFNDTQMLESAYDEYLKCAELRTNQ